MTAPGSQRVLGGRYRLVREIARGGMAAVWQAEDTLLDRLVAVKLLHAQYADDPEFLERFRREARAAARLSHPNIVPIYDVGEDSETRTPYIVMELVAGGVGNLKDRIRQAAPLPDAEIRSIGATLAAALDYAHSKGLIHRDVKPHNILLGEDGRPRLTDFGIAQAVASSGLTRTGAVMGSVHYIAPEVARGQQASPRSDIYSLGVVLYEMATGRVPFHGDTDLAVALAHIEETPAPPTALNAHLAGDLERTILRALSKQPELRFDSAAEFGNALRGQANRAADVTQRMPVAAAAPAASAVARRRAATALAAAPPVPVARRAARPRVRGASNGMVGLLVAMALVLLALGAGFYGLASLSREGVVPPDATAAPTATPTTPPKPAVVPTATRAPATATPEPPSPTPEPPSPTPAPPSPTPAPPSPTPVPPTPTPRSVVVPQLRGRTLEQAQTALSQAGLTVTVRGVAANVDRNVVADQMPSAGATLTAGGTVTLVVGTGQTAVPDVANQPRETAVQNLQNNSFRVILRDRRDSRVPSGFAIGTNPAAGTVLARGSEVELDVSAGR